MSDDHQTRPSLIRELAYGYKKDHTREGDEDSQEKFSKISCRRFRKLWH
jgi:hypothetical protein